MKTIKSYILIVLSTILFSGCSWSEYFTINNLSDKPIYVSYKLSPLSENMTFGVFSLAPTFYKPNRKNNIDWNNKIDVKDSDSSIYVVNVIIPPKTIMIFGRLSNDHYSNSEQYFINGREFNLDFMEIEVNLEVHHISKKTFDEYFKKKKGLIQYTVH